VYILILAESGRELEISREVKKIQGVAESLVVYGEFDVVARAEFRDLTVLDEAVYAIRKIPGVIKTTTLIGSASP